MSPNEKLVIQTTLKYFQMLNQQVYEMVHRLKILEEVMLKNPDLFPQYQKAAKETTNKPSPGLSVQLQALEQELQKILR